MPTYTFYNNQTCEQFDALMKISEREEYLNSNPHIQQIVSAPALVSGVGTTNKVPDGFKEVLSKVSEAHPDSSVSQKHGKKSIKQIKTDNIIQKHFGDK
jgi:hypothetical protein